MSKEEAKEVFINRGFVNGLFDGDKWRESVAVISKWLEQEPKTGHWIEGQTNNPNIHNILCSRCFEGYPSKGHANSQHTKEKFKWCPKCGARMVEPQESEKT